MTFKKIFAPLVSVALVAVMAVSLLGQQRVAHAAVTVTTAGAATANMNTNAATGTGAYTAMTSIVLTGTAAADIPAGNIVLAAPTGWVFDPSQAVVITCAGAGTATCTTPLTAVTSYGSGYGTLTFVVTAASTGAATITVTTPNVRPLSASSTTGNITYSSASTSTLVGLATGATVGTLTAGTAMPTTGGSMTLVQDVASVSTSGADVAKVNVVLSSSTGVLAGNTPVTCTTGLGRIASTLSGALASTATSATLATAGSTIAPTTGVLTATTGIIAFFIKSAGTAGTDTVVCTAGSLGAVQTTTLAHVAASGATATSLSVTSKSQEVTAATTTTIGSLYVSPTGPTTTSSNVTVRALDAASLGVNGQIILVSVDKGAIADSGTGGVAVTCASVSAKSVAVTTATIGSVVGRGQVTYCPLSTQPGTATITFQNLSNSAVPNGTTTIVSALLPSAVTAVVSNNTITATVKDSAGNFVADNTPVSFAIAAATGVVSSACSLTSNGVATTTVALTGTTGAVIASASYNEATAAATCAATGNKQVAISVNVGAGAVTPPTPGATGTFSGGTIAVTGVSIVSFTGSTAVLDTAGAANNPKIVTVSATVGGKMITFVIGAPAFVNAEFNAAFPTGLNGTLVIVKTGA